MLLNLFLLPFSLVFGTDCPSYTCTGTAPTLGTCSSFSSASGQSAYQITPCVFGLECPLAPGLSSSCASISNTRYPGEFCASATDCMSSQCSSGKCQGSPQSAACTSSSQCNPGLYCSSASSQCTPQILEGIACSSDEECENTSLCDQGVCIRMFTGDTGEPTAYIMPVGLAPSCKSGFATASASSFACAATAPVSASAGVTACTADSECVAEDATSSKTCLCGYDAQGRCPLFEGDAQVVAMISGFSAVAALSNNTCHTKNRFGYACFATMSAADLQTYVQWMANAQLYLNSMWVLRENNSECVNATFNADYWNVYRQAQGDPEQVCPQYECANNASEWSNIQCTYYNSDIYYSAFSSIMQVKPCGGNFTCAAPQGDLSNASCTDIPVNLRYSGEFCTINEQCYSGVCTNYLCSGQRLNQVCLTPWNCEPGLFCNTSDYKCAKLAAEGQACSAKLGCGIFLECNLGVCVQAFSLASGVQVGATSGYARACATGFAMTNSTGAFCAQAPVSPAGLTPCINGTTCLDSTGVYARTCVCGNDGAGHCPSFEGDSYLQNAIKAYKQMQALGIQCNTYLGPTDLCFGNSTANMLNFYYYYTNLTYYQDMPFLLNQLDCVQAVYHPEYWAAIEFILSPVNPPSPDKGFAGELVFSALVIFAGYF